MSSTRDYIPRNQLHFNSWQETFMEVLHQYKGEWQIPEADLLALDKLQTVYIPLYAVGNKNLRASRTNVQAARLNIARSEYEAALRFFIAGNIRFNRKVSEDSKFALGVTVPDTIRTRRGTPETIPFVSTLPEKGARVKVYVEQQQGKDGTSRRGKPKDVARIEVAWFIGNDPPANADIFPMKSQWGRSPVLIKFDKGQSGNLVTIYARFVGYNNEGGPWSAQHKEIITM